jgi:hypothetical protein
MYIYIIFSNVFVLAVCLVVRAGGVFHSKGEFRTGDARNRPQN